MNLGFDLNDWENSDIVEQGEYETLDLGGHIVKIKSAEVYNNPNNGNVSLKVCIDTAENDKQPSFFQKKYDSNNNANKKWSNGAIKYFSLKKDSLKYLRGFVETTLPNSNPNFVFDKTKGWGQLVGLKCVGVFGLEEYVDTDGNNRMSTKLTQLRSLDKLNDVKIPKVKYLDGTTIEYEIYKNRKNDSANLSQIDPIEPAVTINPQDLPF